MKDECVPFFSSIFLPVDMALIGARFKKNPPKRVNWLYGYRTARSMKSQEAWDYANRRMGEVWWHTGLVVGGASLLVADSRWRDLETVSLGRNSLDRRGVLHRGIDIALLTIDY
jgi:uncharacterized membrane protein